MREARWSTVDPGTVRVGTLTDPFILEPTQQLFGMMLDPRLRYVKGDVRVVAVEKHACLGEVVRQKIRGPKGTIRVRPGIPSVGAAAKCIQSMHKDQAVHSVSSPSHHGDAETLVASWDLGDGGPVLDSLFPLGAI